MSAHKFSNTEYSYVNTWQCALTCQMCQKAPQNVVFSVTVFTKRCITVCSAKVNAMYLEAEKRLIKKVKT